MATIDHYKSIPSGSILILDSSKQQSYLERFFDVSPALKQLLTAQKTGSFIRGLAKTHQLAPEQAPQIAFAVLRVAVGEVALGKLGTVLSSELKLANDKAQAMAAEIERDLFASVSRELNQFLENKKKQAGKSQGDAAKTGGAKNVINLKDEQQPPKPPQIPLPPRK